MNGKAWKQARNARGMSLDEACYRVRDQLGQSQLSRSTLNRMETHDIDLAPQVVAALAIAYDQLVSEIDPVESEKLGELRDLLVRSALCIPELAA